MAHEGFSKLKSMLAKRGNVKNPAAVAAKIGQEKYGKKNMEEAAQKKMSVPTLLKHKGSK